MDWNALFWLAVGLALDAAAVSAARGFRTARILPRHVLLVALYFGGFQALMPVLGWALGRELGPLVQTFDHWIAFVLLVAIGAKMLWEARGSATNEGRHASDPFGAKVMLVLAFGTSVDAFAVGVMLPMMDAPFWLSIATIGVTTATLCVLGLFAGRKFGALLSRRLDFLGGIVLIVLGTKILVEHLRAS
jgi:putative Mn2+ efflux pump MntP